MFAQGFIALSKRLRVIAKFADTILRSENWYLVCLPEKPAEPPVFKEIAARQEIQGTWQQHRKQTGFKKGTRMITYKQQRTLTWNPICVDQEDLPEIENTGKACHWSQDVINHVIFPSDCATECR